LAAAPPGGGQQQQVLDGDRVADEHTDRGSYILSGAAVDDPEALAQMDIPGHETAVEIPKVTEEDLHGPAKG